MTCSHVSMLTVPGGGGTTRVPCTDPAVGLCAYHQGSILPTAAQEARLRAAQAPPARPYPAALIGVARRMLTAARIDGYHDDHRAEFRCNPATWEDGILDARGGHSGAFGGTEPHAGGPWRLYGAEYNEDRRIAPGVLLLSVPGRAGWPDPPWLAVEVIPAEPDPATGAGA